MTAEVPLPTDFDFATLDAFAKQIDIDFQKDQDPNKPKQGDGKPQQPKARFDTGQLDQYGSIDIDFNEILTPAPKPQEPPQPVKAVTRPSTGPKNTLDNLMNALDFLINDEDDNPRSKPAEDVPPSSGPQLTVTDEDGEVQTPSPLGYEEYGNYGTYQNYSDNEDPDYEFYNPNFPLIIDDGVFDLIDHLGDNFEEANIADWALDIQPPGAGVETHVNPALLEGLPASPPEIPAPVQPSSEPERSGRDPAPIPQLQLPTGQSPPSPSALVPTRTRRRSSGSPKPPTPTLLAQSAPHTAIHEAGESEESDSASPENTAGRPITRNRSVHVTPNKRPSPAPPSKPERPSSSSVSLPTPPTINALSSSLGATGSSSNLGPKKQIKFVPTRPNSVPNQSDDSSSDVEGGPGAPRRLQSMSNMEKKANPYKKQNIQKAANPPPLPIQTTPGSGDKLPAKSMRQSMMMIDKNPMVIGGLLSIDTPSLFHENMTIFRMATESMEQTVKPINYWRENYYKVKFFGEVHYNFYGTKDQSEYVVISVVRKPSKEGYVCCRTDKRGSSLFHLAPALIEAKKGVSVPQAIEHYLCSNAFDEGWTYNYIDDIEFGYGLIGLEEKHRQNPVAFKIAILYSVGTELSLPDFFAHKEASPGFWKFIELIGTKIELNGWKRYRGDFVCSNTTQQSYYKEFKNIEIMYHLSMMMDSEQHRRLIGNDVVFFMALELYLKYFLLFNKQQMDTEHKYLLVQILKILNQNYHQILNSIHQISLKSF